MKVIEVTDPASIPPAAQVADYQAPPEAVLELVDSQLAAFEPDLAFINDEQSR